MLRYRADLRTIAFLLVYLGLVVSLWTLDVHGPLLAVGVIVTCVFSWVAAVIAHNTVHCPVFKKRWMNRAFQVWVSLSYGFPISEYVPGHNLSHHRFTQEREDVMRTTKVRYRWNLLNGLLFFFAVAPGVTIGNYRYVSFMKTRQPAWHRQLLLEIFMVWGTKLALLMVDWKKCLLLIVVPHLFAVWGITTINLAQHDGCDPSHRANHSRNFVGRFINWIALNNGYHGIHHEQPGLHWSLLPAAHAEKIHPYIDPALEQPSLGLYVFRTFIYPGVRTRYDGTPMPVPSDGPDKDWVAATRDVAEQELGALQELNGDMRGNQAVPS
ncbi:MAG: fatty acid desaturase [Polyangiaceae bacterium]|nr:fatty acid desaturase [Polyangiaceae bacterium]